MSSRIPGFEVVGVVLREGEPSRTASLFPHAWEELEELQVQSREDCTSNGLAYLQAHDRTELLAYSGFTLAGGMVYTYGIDGHVGHCAYPLYGYVRPEYRHLGIYREFRRRYFDAARRMGIGVVAVTDRLGPWTYRNRYKRIN